MRVRKARRPWGTGEGPPQERIHDQSSTLGVVAHRDRGIRPSRCIGPVGPPGLNTTYISLSGLYVVPLDSDYSEKSDGTTFASDLEMDASFGLLFAFGYGADVGLRGEVELGYRKVDLDKFDGLTSRGDGETTSYGTFPVKGDLTTLSLMANGIYVLDAGKLRPYFGVGIGLARHDGTIDEQTLENAEYVAAVEKVSDDDTVLAYQGMVGVAFPLAETTEVRIGYRYFATADADFDGTEASYGTHNLEAGILIRF